jgi:Cullin family
MTVFKYVEDKDVFQKFYSRMLSRRLVNSTQASDEAEASMITKLKEACGFEYTNKLSRMFQDMGVSKDLERAFLDSLTDRESLGRNPFTYTSNNSRLFNLGAEYLVMAIDCAINTIQFTLRTD